MMYRLSFVLILLTNYLCIKVHSYPARSRKINLFFDYYHEYPKKFDAIEITGDTVSKNQTRCAYVLTGNALNRIILNISSISFKRDAACRDTTPSIYIILENIWMDDAVRIDGKSYTKKIRQYFTKFMKSAANNKGKQQIFTCTIQYINDKPKDFNPYHLSKTGLFGVIFLSACVILTFALCTAWFAILYYRRFHHRRMKNKLQKALALSVQQMLDKSPIIIFDSKDKNNNDNTDEEPMCAICLEIFIDNEKIRKLVCSHYFHIACIDPWLLTHQSCPLCNRNVLSDSVPSISAHVTAVDDQLNNRNLQIH